MGDEVGLDWGCWETEGTGRTEEDWGRRETVGWHAKLMACMGSEGG